ncbi:tetratricopeptide repeat protein [Methylacidiphilum kamchatkense]|uniref:Tetratricopeptide repeat protein n=1 Tax=Methylacidiphilum kamchatkense Kam1 TaxID=1202785 RepID=A0A516TNU3_9BACT|nr:tetratricopeptide repeat protein [Methylacidiphilum kamchatkense]QDQ42923.1 tetratricopeptide repeat protein [Methylacidiphilum kamchatkense Kam1]
MKLLLKRYYLWLLFFFPILEASHAQNPKTQQESYSQQPSDNTTPISFSQSKLRPSDKPLILKGKAFQEKQLHFFTNAIQLEQRKDWKGLLVFSKQWIAAFPSEAAAYFFLGIAYENLGHYSRAIEAYKKAIHLKKDFAKAWCNLGTCYAYVGQYAEATEAFKHALAGQPDLAKAWSNLGACYIELGQYSQAIKALKKAIRLKPELAESWCNLGTAYGEKKDYHKAIESLRKAIELRPDYMEAWWNLAKIYEKTKNVAEKTKAEQKIKEIAHQKAK